MEWTEIQGIHLKRKKRSAVILLFGVMVFILLNKFDLFSSTNVEKVVALILLVATFIAAEYLTFLRLKKKKRKKMKKLHKQH